MRFKTLLGLTLFGSLCFTGCGGVTKTGTPPPPSPTITSVTVTCVATSLQPRQTSQCSAAVAGTGSYTSAVTWSATSGTISSTGLYTAPATAPASGSDTVKATATEDSTKLGTAKITIAAPAPPTITSVTVSCAATSLQPSQTSQCSAAVAGTASYSSTVTWSATSGTISSTGLYTAPATVPTSGSDTIKATSTQDSAKLGTAKITITAPATPTITSVSVSCAPTSLHPSQTSQCSATVTGTGSYSSSVTWSATSGTVSSTGLYTAPSTAPASGSDTVKATSTQDTTKQGTAKIAISAPAAPTITSVSVSCAATSLQPSQTSQCAATVSGTGSYSSSVTWSAVSGTVSSTGLYTAPSTVPTSGSDTVKATSTQDSTKQGTAKITITAPTPPTITAVSLACSPTSITDAQTTSCTPTVTGTGAFTNTVNLSLSPSAAGTLSDPTSVSSGTAVIFTPANTGADAVTITATSTADATKSHSVPITVTAATAGPSCSNMSLGDNASLNGFLPFTPTTAWNTDISSAPLDPNNTAITSAAGFAGLHLHHDWSSVAGGNYGIPYVVVDSSSTPLIPISVVDYADESDVAEAPYPITAPIEGAPADCDGWPDTYIGDSHVLVLDRHACMLYETFNTHRCSGAWSASSETIWDLKNYDRRPWGWTSADAAGLPIFPGLVRYDEVAAGAINHAIRFTMQQTKNDANGGYFVAPASHAAGTTYGVSNIMGMRIRLKASFDISGYSAANQVILTAMKKYGMILADNGSYFYFQGVPDPRWDDDDLHNLDSIQSSNFEVVQMTPTFPGYDANTAPTGATPIINSFTSSASSVAAGTPITLTWNTTNDSYDFIDVLGGVSGGTVTTTPTKTTTYTLNATSQYGRTTMQVTVTVH